MCKARQSGAGRAAQKLSSDTKTLSRGPVHLEGPWSAKAEQHVGETPNNMITWGEICKGQCGQGEP